VSKLDTKLKQGKWGAYAPEDLLSTKEPAAATKCEGRLTPGMDTKVLVSSYS
jgi:hypothetical protein